MVTDTSNEKWLKSHYRKLVPFRERVKLFFSWSLYKRTSEGDAAVRNLINRYPLSSFTQDEFTINPVERGAKTLKELHDWLSIERLWIENKYYSYGHVYTLAGEERNPPYKSTQRLVLALQYYITKREKEKAERD